MGVPGGSEGCTGGGGGRRRRRGGGGGGGGGGEIHFFDVSDNTIVLPEEADLSLQSTSRAGPAYNAAAMVDALLG